MSAKYILLDRKMGETQKQIDKMQMAKWIILFASLPTVVLFPVAVIVFIAVGSKQKKLRATIAELELAMMADA